MNENTSMDMRVLLKNYTVLALAAGALVGLLIGLLLGNIALGVILLVGILIGALALLDELGIDFQRAVDERLGRVTAPVPPDVTRAAPASRRSEKSPVVSPIPPVKEEPPTRQPQEVATGATVEEPRPPAAPKTSEAERETSAAAADRAPILTSKVASKAETKPRTVALVAGTGQQLDRPAPAAEIYTSPLFQLSMAYAQAQEADAVYVLSAKHVVLAPDAVVTPYEESLTTMTSGQLKAWSDKVLRELRKLTDPQHDRYILLAAGKYRKHLEAGLSHVELPTEGMTLGQQLEFLKEQTATPD